MGSSGGVLGVEWWSMGLSGGGSGPSMGSSGVV